MAQTNCRRERGGYVIDWRGTSAEFQGLRADLKSDQAEGVVKSWTAFHLPGDQVRAIIRTAGIPELANE